MSIVTTIILALVVFVAALAFARALRRRKARKEGAYRLRKDALFSRGERAFLDALEPSLPSGVRLFGKVRLSDIFTLSDQVSQEDQLRARGRINQKHVDYLLVRADDMSPLAGIELDDRTHDSADRQERDAFVDTVFASGGLPLLHFPAQRAYSRAEIRGRVDAALRGAA